MKALVIAVALLAFLAGPVLAGQCPLLVKQLNEAVAKMKADDPKVTKAKPMIACANKECGYKRVIEEPEEAVPGPPPPMPQAVAVT